MREDERGSALARGRGAGGGGPKETHRATEDEYWLWGGGLPSVERRDRDTVKHQEERPPVPRHWLS